MFFQNRDGLNEQICVAQNEFLNENSKTKSLFDAEAIIKKSVEGKQNFDLHNFDECLRFRLDHKDHGLINGKYCVIAFNSTTETKLKYTAVCYPDSCSDISLQHVSKGFFDDTQYTMHQQWCQTTHLEYKLSDYMAFIFFALLALIVIISTFYDYYKRHSDNKKAWLTTFSLYSNVKRVFRTSASDDMNCLYALRVLSIFWLIIANRFYTMQKFPLTDEETFNEWLQNGFSAFISAYDVAYDTFFMVSGFILATYCLKAYASKSMNYIHLLLHRYFRYVPLLAAAIIYYVSILKFTVTGPMVYRLTKRIENCQNYWWTTILLVENYVSPDHVCLYDGWYFNVDFQFFIILPLLVYIFFKFRKVGTVLLYTILIGVYTTVITLLILYDTPYDVINQVSALPIHSHFRCAPWIISIYLANLCLKKELKFKKSTRILCWIATSAIFVAHFVTAYILQNENYVSDSIIIGAIFAGVHRIFWALAISWIIIVCIKLETDSVVKKILNSSKWKPLGKLTVTMLIVHPLYQIATTYSLKSSYDFSPWWTFHAGLGDIVFTTFLAIILYGSIEIPFVTMEKAFHWKKKQVEIEAVQIEKVI
ncbi:hypothetical protein PVAND_006965 [Polypedilum vanderplanki]|uniref:Acyltransferase 3 domain-containing protein n=1 Tax=Polypedilum vanderplanki TaxID=319348 RepID=A0A9J6C5S7_POLVA|nr:hypothetical protein PVAND_006965 [Polypedilum vanderplanki]